MTNEHRLECNYHNLPIGQGGCICKVVNKHEWAGMVAEIERLRRALRRIDYEAQSDAVADIAREALKEKPCKA